jgi:alpha-glucosidase
MSTPPWWRGAVIYQIYPRSFQDTDGNGIGDLPGIIRRLDYVASLGVDAIWVSPFFTSPMADFGYDISDNCDVDPLFGTLADFDALVREAHARGLKVVIDQVLSHTSDQHAWFRESRESRDNAKADWYVWADARDDGAPPNNWLSIFGGVAWQWEPRRRQYYLHNFLTSQPDLNFHHPDVRAAALGNLRFWLERGVDGFRLDSINFCFHDRALRDNPPKPVAQRVGRGFSPDNPYAFQYHWYNNTQPENVELLRDIRALLDEYGETTTLGEISSEDSLATMAEYTGPDKLHMGYSFELLTDDFSAAHVRTTVEALEAKMTAGWPCWAISNHDVRRVASRWLAPDAPAHAASMLTALACSLRGSACVYQGEELGLREADVPFELLQDPYGIAFWPTFKGRDGCRTPMPWTAAADGDFSSAAPWLPIPPDHRARNVMQQESESDSALQRFRTFLRWRKQQPALMWGEVRMLPGGEPVIALERHYEGRTIGAYFNTSDRECEIDIGAGSRTVLEGHGLVAGELSGRRARLPPYGVLFLATP